MCNLFLGDEINRTSPKTQSALLEVMEEGQVSVDGVTHALPKPFIVLATQNPAGSAGTQLLPQSQLDRFTICLSLGYPDMEEEIAILKGRISSNPLENLHPVLETRELLLLQEECRQIFIHDRIYHYICSLMQATRVPPYGGTWLQSKRQSCPYPYGAGRRLSRGKKLCDARGRAAGFPGCLSSPPLSQCQSQNQPCRQPLCTGGDF